MIVAQVGRLVRGGRREFRAANDEAHTKHLEQVLDILGKEAIPCRHLWQRAVPHGVDKAEQILAIIVREVDNVGHVVRVCLWGAGPLHEREARFARARVRRNTMQVRLPHPHHSVCYPVVEVNLDRLA